MKYRKKPVVIEALQWTGYNDLDMYNFLEDEIRELRDFRDYGRNFYIDHIRVKGGLIIKTLEGDHVASINDYIIKGIKGEFYPCKPDVFELTYDKEEEDDGRVGCNC